MKQLSVVVMMFFVSAVHAEIFNSKIDRIEISKSTSEESLVYLENGRVLFLGPEDRAMIPILQEGKKKDDEIRFKVSKDVNFETASTAIVETEEDTEVDEQRNFSFDPTIVTNDQAVSIFAKFNRRHQRSSQCYNRAHVWAYEEFRRSGLQSRKHFLFFTRRYIRNYRYKWWFHVAPSVEVAGLGTRIMDRTFTKGPRSISNWLMNFIHSGRSCPVVNKYSDYRNHQESQDCYLIPVSMYYWQPRDIDRFERTGFEKTSFIKSEVDHAYWEAF